MSLKGKAIKILKIIDYTKGIRKCSFHLKILVSHIINETVYMSAVFSSRFAFKIPTSTLNITIQLAIVHRPSKYKGDDLSLIGFVM